VSDPTSLLATGATWGMIPPMIDPTEPRVIGPGFHGQVYAVVREVPAGRVTTYGDVATILGSPRVARQVGWALAALRNADPDDVPWHRVINAQGMISARGDFVRGTMQENLLAAEGIHLDDRGKVVGFAKARWRFAPRG
jgi:methylated-DNA-protein-cysteine methyltransferase-like protein